MGSIDSVQLDCTVGLKGTSLGNFIAESKCRSAKPITSENIFMQPQQLSKLAIFASFDNCCVNLYHGQFHQPRGVHSKTIVL